MVIALTDTKTLEGDPRGCGRERTARPLSSAQWMQMLAAIPRHHTSSMAWRGWVLRDLGVGVESKVRGCAPGTPDSLVWSGLVGSGLLAGLRVGSTSLGVWTCACLVF